MGEYRNKKNGTGARAFQFVLQNQLPEWFVKLSGFQKGEFSNEENAATFVTKTYGRLKVPLNWWVVDTTYSHSISIISPWDFKKKYEELREGKVPEMPINNQLVNKLRNIQAAYKFNPLRVNGQDLSNLAESAADAIELQAKFRLEDQANVTKCEKEAADLREDLRKANQCLVGMAWHLLELDRSIREALNCWDEYTNYVFDKNMPK